MTNWWAVRELHHRTIQIEMNLLTLSVNKCSNAVKMWGEKSKKEPVFKNIFEQLKSVLNIYKSMARNQKESNNDRTD